MELFLRASQAQQEITVKVTQELMRHANSSTTLNLYAKAVTLSKRRAHEKIVDGLLDHGTLSTTIPNSIPVGAETEDVGYAFLTKSRKSFVKWWPETGSNRRRRPFQGRALPLSYLALAMLASRRLDRQEGSHPADNRRTRFFREG